MILAFFLDRGLVVQRVSFVWRAASSGSLRRLCSWERCQSDIHSKMFAPRRFRLRMLEWLSL